ncbi:outer spore coat protein CotE [Salsuginibacillus kocurii]|uniref:outer spore coat protein CotE n=1 Tax=Salsuginibacillus kocurii TaxID=427078 RepID=UPI00036BDCD3|nr:outer spore coat protein CotE [Salsuginibacillus kocurii]
MSPDPSYREIVTKAVCGKGKKESTVTHQFRPNEKPTSILGCWIINHEYDAAKQEDSILVFGQYDVNIWYSYEDNTKTDVFTKTVSYEETVPLTMSDEPIMSEQTDVIARAVKQPNTLEASISEDKEQVVVEVERSFACEMVGETKMTVQMHPDQEDMNYRDVNWDEQVADDELKSIEPNFLQAEDEEESDE